MDNNGGGFTSNPDSKGDHMVVIAKGLSQGATEYSLGETIAHEVIGHSLGSYLNEKDEHVGAIQVSNIYRSIKGISPLRDGTQHRNINGPLSKEQSSRIPEYLKYSDFFSINDQ